MHSDYFIAAVALQQRFSATASTTSDVTHGSHSEEYTTLQPPLLST